MSDRLIVVPRPRQRAFAQNFHADNCIRVPVRLVRQARAARHDLRRLPAERALYRIVQTWDEKGRKGRRTGEGRAATAEGLALELALAKVGDDAARAVVDEDV